MSFCSTSPLPLHTHNEDPARVPDAAMQAFVQDLIQTLWVHQDHSRLLDFYHPDAIFEGLIPGEEMPLPDYLDALQQMLLLITMNGFRIDDCFSNGRNRLAAGITYHITVNTTGSTADLRGEITYTLRDGRVTRVRLMLDRLGFLEAIGAVPEDTFFHALSGGHLS